MFSQAVVATAFWQMLGPFGGAAHGVRVAPNQHELVVVYTADAQLFVTSNKGLEWRAQYFPAQHEVSMHALVIDPKDAHLWLAGVEDGRGRLSGLYRTTNSGESWEFPAELKGKAVWSIAVSEAHPGLVIAGTDDGVYRSQDRGETWTRISAASYSDLRPVVSLAIDPTNANIIVAGTTHLPWRTTDGGQTWESIHKGMHDDSDVFSVVIHPQNTATVYASACSGAYRSTNGGQLWTHLATPRGTFRTYVVAVDITKPNIVYAGTSGGLLRSSDEGRTWVRASEHSVYSIDFDRSGERRAYFASSGGILVSDNGGPLRELSRGFGNRTWAQLVGMDTHLFALYTQGNDRGLYRSVDSGRNWVRLKPVPSGLVSILGVPQPRGPLYIATRNQVLRSTNQGNTWLPVGRPITTATIDAIAAGGETGNVIFVAAGKALYRNGPANTWVALPATYQARVRSISTAGVNVTTSSRMGVGFSRDNGKTWQPCQTPSSEIEWYDAAWVKAGLLVAATSHGLFSSPDCVTWSPVRHGLDASTVTSIFVDRPNGLLLASQRGLVFQSADGGETWKAVTEHGGSTSMPTRLLLLPGAKDRIFALFARGGVAEWPPRPEVGDAAGGGQPSGTSGKQ